MTTAQTEPVPDERSDAAVLAEFPGIPISQDNIRIYRARRSHRLLVANCAECGRFHAPARRFCPDCLSGATGLVEVSGRGILALKTRVYIGPLVAGVDYATGHDIGVVDIAEQPGVRLAGPLLTPDAEIGTPMTVAWLDRESGIVPGFRAEVSS